MADDASAQQPSTETLGEGQFLKLVKDGKWEYVSRKVAPQGAVQIVAVDNAGMLLLVEQYRPPVRANVIELPAGLIDEAGGEGEGAAEVAKRELTEETGYACAEIRLLHRGPPSPGMSDEFNAFYLATALTKVSDGGGVDGEDITVHRVPLVSAPAWLEQRQRDGVHVDPKVFAGLFFAKANRI